MNNKVPCTASERQRRAANLVARKYVRRKLKQTKPTEQLATQASPRGSEQVVEQEFTTPTKIQKNTKNVAEESCSESEEGSGSSGTKDISEDRPSMIEEVQGPHESSSSASAPDEQQDNGLPIDRTVLKSFETHVAYAIWNRTKHDTKCLSVVSHWAKMGEWDLSGEVDGVQSRVKLSGLYNLVEYGYRYIDKVAVSAFVERWQPDTNTFHLPFGEMTITLDDVRNIFGIPVEGNCMHTSEGGREIKPDVALQMVGDLLGVTQQDVEDETQRTYTVRMEWLKINFKNKAKVDSTEVELDQCAKAYILYMIGCIILPDKTKNKISIYYLGCLRDIEKVSDYGWGMAILANLYRQLGLASRVGVKYISGCLNLLMAWIFEHFPFCGSAVPNLNYSDTLPRLCKWKPLQCAGDVSSRLVKLREQLDDLTEADVCWDPYKDQRDTRPLHEVTFYCGLLVCFDVIEPYYPDRVLRQFGRVQMIPSMPMFVPQTVERGKETYKLVYKTSTLHQMNNWSNHLLNPLLRSKPVNSPWDCSSGYMEWFLKITHPIIQHPMMRKTTKIIRGDSNKEVARLKMEINKAKKVIEINKAKKMEINRAVEVIPTIANNGILYRFVLYVQSTITTDGKHLANKILSGWAQNKSTTSSVLSSLLTQ